MNIPAYENGVIRLFALDLPADQIETFRSSASGGKGTLQTTLGATYLDEDFIEIFPVSDLEGLGLARYMATGNGVPDDQLDAIRGQLDHLNGHVVLIHSSAFGDFAQTITARAPLRYIATFYTRGMPVQFAPLPDDSAQLGSGVDKIKKQPSQAAMMGRIATFTLLFLFMFTALIVWLGS